MTRHTITNLFVSAAVALAALILIVGVVGAKDSAPLLTEPPAISSASHQVTTSTLALPQVITTLHPFVGITPPAWPIRVGIDPHSGYIYIVCEENNLVLILRGTQVVSWIDRGTDWWIPQLNQHGIAVDPLNGYVYVGNIFRNEISILSGRQPITTIAYPFSYSAGHILEANPFNGYVYAAIPDGIAVFSGTQTHSQHRTDLLDLISGREIV